MSTGPTWMRALQSDLRPMPTAQKFICLIALALGLIAYASSGLSPDEILGGLAIGLAQWFSTGRNALTRTIIRMACFAALVATFSAIWLMPEWKGGFVLALLTVNAAWTVDRLKHSADAARVFSQVLVSMTCAILNQESLLSVALGVLAILASILATAWSADGAQKTWGAWRAGARLVLLMGIAAPLGLLVFFFYPRTPLGFNQVTGPGGSATMGLSTSMSPGSVGDLVQSNKLAFHASFYVETFSPNSLYWRATAFDHFDGKTWTATSSSGNQDLNTQAGPRKTSPSAAAERYALDLPASLGNFIPVLDSTIAGSVHPTSTSNQTERIKLADKGLYRYVGEGGPPIRLAALANLSQSSVQAGEPTPEDVKIPEEGNEKIRQRASQWASDAGGDAAALIDRFSAHIRKEPFAYTLKPPVWRGRNGIDQFFFETRSGFCEHYASTFVYFMRAAGIPARVVTGFVGGDVDGTDVRILARDAHAWAEVWLPGAGWRRVDPTSFIAPSRVEAQTRNVLERPIGWAALAQAWSSKLGAAWYETIVFYNEDSQHKFVDRWLGSGGKIVRWLGLAGLLIGTMVLGRRAGKIWRLQRNLTPQMRLVSAYKQIIHKLQHQGWNASSSAAPTELAHMLEAGQDLNGQPLIVDSALKDWLSQYERLRYAMAEPEATQQEILDMVRMARRWGG